MPKNIPVNLVTGFLGAGKTTVIRHLLVTRPTGARWAVLVNEFGAHWLAADNRVEAIVEAGAELPPLQSVLDLLLAADSR